MNGNVAPETRRGPWGPFATAAFTVLIALVFWVTQTALAIPYLVIKVARSPGTNIEAAGRALQTDGLFFGLAEAGGGLVALGATILIAWLRRGPVLREYFALRSVPRPTMLAWLLYTALLGVFLDGIAYLTGHAVVSNWMLAVYRSAAFLPLFLFSVLVVAPLLEEFVFRGFLFEGVLRSRLGGGGAILLAALVWASLHLQYEWFYIGQIFCLGLLLGTARLLTRSLVPPIVMHAVFSGIATLQTALQCWS